MSKTFDVSSRYGLIYEDYFDDDLSGWTATGGDWEIDYKDMAQYNYSTGTLNYINNVSEPDLIISSKMKITSRTITIDN